MERGVFVFMTIHQYNDGSFRVDIGCTDDGVKAFGSARSLEQAFTNATREYSRVGLTPWIRQCFKDLSEIKIY